MTLRFVDPGHAALRTATRVALVMTAVAAVGHTVIDDPGFSTFASFGSFALLGLANFAGPLRTRFGLGLGFALCGAAIVVIGTLASGHLAASMLVVLVVGSTLTFAAVFGGYAAAGGNGLILAAVLSVMIPAEVDAIPERMGGWLFAGVVGAVASVVLWPERPRSRIRTGLASIAGELSDAVRTFGPDSGVELDRIGRSVRALREQVDTALSRPGGPRSRDLALLFLLDELGRASIFLRRLLRHHGESGALTAEDQSMLAASGAVLRASAEVLEGEHVDPPVDRLVELRSAEIARVGSRLAGDAGGIGAATGEGATGDAVVARVDVLFPVRMFSYLSLSIATNALVAVGRPPGDTSFEFQLASPALRTGWRDVVRRALATLRAHLRPSSRWFRNAVRVGVALAASVAVADAVQLDHAFWIVLGTLSVLRSSVLDTGATAIESVIGTLLGFAVASVAMLLVGDDRAALWVLLPIVVFGAGYLPGVVNYLVGQAAFTLMVVVLFNLSDPIGWQLGLVRLERVALGVTVSLLAAVLIWPRGVTQDLARAVATEYRAAVRYSRCAVDHLLGRSLAAGAGTDLPSVHHAALAARDVAEGEFGDLMNSRGSKQVTVDTWSRLVTQPHTVLLGGDWMRRIADRQGRPAAAVTSTTSVTAAVDALGVAADRVDAELSAAADGLGATTAVADGSLDGGTTRVDTTSALADARRAVVAMLDDHAATSGLSEHQLLALLWTLEWFTFLGDLCDDVSGELRATRAEVTRSWWR